MFDETVNEAQRIANRGRLTTQNSYNIDIGNFNIQSTDLQNFTITNRNGSVNIETEYVCFLFPYLFVLNNILYMFFYELNNSNETFLEIYSATQNLNLTLTDITDLSLINPRDITLSNVFILPNFNGEYVYVYESTYLSGGTGYYYKIEKNSFITGQTNIDAPTSQSYIARMNEINGDMEILPITYNNS